MTKGLLFASFDTSPAQADEFNDWYDQEHVPERLRVPGFLNAQRWIGDENPKIAVATYDLATHAVMDSPQYQAIGGANGSIWTKRITAIAKRLLRFEGTQIVPGDVTAPAEANALLAVAIDVEPAVEPEFNEWFFATVHLILAGNDSEGLQYGTTGTPEKFFLKWKEDEHDNTRYKLDKYLLKLCNKDRLIELLHDFRGRAFWRNDSAAAVI